MFVAGIESDEEKRYQMGRAGAQSSREFSAPEPAHLWTVSGHQPMKMATNATPSTNAARRMEMVSTLPKDPGLRPVDSAAFMPIRPIPRPAPMTTSPAFAMAASAMMGNMV